MVNYDKLIRVYPAPALVTALPYLLSAAVGVGTAVYTQGKAEDAADQKAAANAQKTKESLELGEAKSKEARERAMSQSAQKEAGNDAAFNDQLSAMERSAQAEKRQQEEARLANAQDPQEQYAAKFKPGTDLGNKDSAMDFLVPRVAEGTGLVADSQAGPQGGGLQTPLGFDV